MNYDLDYFITFFEAIPEDQWCTEMYDGPNNTRCALGHLADPGHFTPMPRQQALVYLWQRLIPARRPADYVTIYAINDDTSWGTGPKDRVVTYLKAIKEFYI